MTSNSQKQNNTVASQQEAAAVRKPPSSPGGCYGAYLEFQNNVPVPRYNPPPDGLVTKQVAHSKFLEALSKPFDGKIQYPGADEELDVRMPEMIGKPVIEVLLAVLTSKALLGDQKACDTLLDRAYGKPAQETTNINIDATETYEQFLEKVAAQQNISLYGDDVIDVDARPVEPDDELEKLLEDF